MYVAIDEAAESSPDSTAVAKTKALRRHHVKSERRAALYIRRSCQSSQIPDLDDQLVCEKYIDLLSP